ncbi:ATP/GTP-binding protein [Streptomyces sp. NPDC048643]|uniref:ATP/GTP-binding protein n=1 Tax=Streptomyces sp. NPDC048643 TaxID=3155637 RepID=UPI00341239BA
MLTTLRAVVTTITVLGAALTTPLTSYAAGDEGGVKCGRWNCEVEVDVPGQGSGGQSGGNGGTRGSGSSHGKGADADTRRDYEKVCTYKLSDPQPPTGSLDWEGHKPGDGAVYERSCSIGPDGHEDLWVTEMVWLANPPAQQTIDPAVLAQRAVDSMTLRGPDIASPRMDGKYTVGVPLWMWVNRSATTYGPNSASASAGGITVTAKATVSKIVWKMGDGSSVTCTGPGTPYTASNGMAKSPTCGHVYDKTSAGSSGGRYPLTATSTWTIDWQGGGETGQLTEIRQTNMTVSIGELQVVR